MLTHRTEKSLRGAGRRGLRVRISRRVRAPSARRRAPLPAVTDSDYGTERSPQAPRLNPGKRVLHGLRQGAMAGNSEVEEPGGATALGSAVRGGANGDAGGAGGANGNTGCAGGGGSRGSRWRPSLTRQNAVIGWRRSSRASRANAWPARGSPTRSQSTLGIFELYFRLGSWPFITAHQLEPSPRCFIFGSAFRSGWRWPQ